MINYDVEDNAAYQSLITCSSWQNFSTFIGVLVHLMGFVSSLKMQREDWRQRPLPAEMVQYARTDAHYLLYVANCLTSELKLYGTGTQRTYSCCTKFEIMC